MSETVPLSRQISALNAEILIRKGEHAAAIRRGTMRRSEADYAIESLEAAADTLRRLQARSRHINQRMFNDDVAPVGGCW